VRELREEHPHLDLENLLSGALAGPASPDRPDVAVWDSLDFVETHPSTSLSQLLAPIAASRPVTEAWSATLSRVPASSVRVVAERFEYGDGPMQYGLFRRADGPARGTVVLIHGGFWRGTAEYFNGPSPLAEALVARGWHVWQIEYRQLPNGGGWPGTLDDTAAAVEHLAVVADALHVELGPVITVGHSAGGHLAVWALSRPDAVLGLTGAVSLAGVLNLLLGEQEDIGDGAVTGFLGGSSADHPDRYAASDPMSRIEPRLPVRIVHGDLDDVVPMNQSDTYVVAAREAGQDVDITVVAGGDHMVVIEPGHAAFEALLVALDRIRATA
jgi:acetyl esterase/lipase